MRTVAERINTFEFVLFAVLIERRQDHIWETVQSVLREKRYQTRLALLEDLSFYVFRSDTNAVLARGIQGFEAAKAKANDLRKQNGLKWDQVKFKAERGNQSSGGSSGSTASRTASSKNRFGVSPDGRNFTNASGETSRVDYSRRYNPSKGRRFRGYTDSQGNYHDID